MREILFRGKRIANGEWVEGCLLNFDEESGYVFICPFFHGASTMPVSRIVEYTSLYVNPETVGQFTGLTDKNGKKIFEGDILKYQINIKTAIVGKIAFLCGAFVFESEELDRECDIAFATFADDEIALPENCIEVIGNIHDNPELLETV